MKHMKLVGAAVLSLMLAAPTMATSNSHNAYRRLHDPAAHRMRAQDFDHFDLGIARPTYHSGWSGPYGDGDYPGTIDRNMGPPYLGFRAY
jgi:hypothetical protein